MVSSVLAMFAASILSLAASGDPVRLDNGATLIVEPVPGCGAVSVIASYATGFATPSITRVTPSVTPRSCSRQSTSTPGSFRHWFYWASSWEFLSM